MEGERVGRRGVRDVNVLGMLAVVWNRVRWDGNALFGGELERFAGS